MTHDTAHPSARTEKAATPRPRGTFMLPTAYGPNVELEWLQCGDDAQGIILRAGGMNAATLVVDLGPKTLVVAALRSVARDIEAAPAWTAVAVEEPAA